MSCVRRTKKNSEQKRNTMKRSVIAQHAFMYILQCLHDLYIGGEHCATVLPPGQQTFRLWLLVNTPYLQATRLIQVPLLIIEQCMG